MWHNLDSTWLAKQVLQLHMAVVVGIVNRQGSPIETCHRNQHNRIKVALYMSISIKTEHSVT